MKCPKCGKDNRAGNFCNNCGAPLKERCLECGGMEPISRPVCETMLKNIRDQLTAFTESEMSKRWFVDVDSVTVLSLFGPLPLLVFALTFAAANGWIFPRGTGTSVSALSGALTGLSIIALYSAATLALTKRADKIGKAISERFFVLHPDDKELFDKAKGE